MYICSPSGRWTRPAAFRAGRELIAQADVGQRSAHHHFVIAAARAIGIEVLGLHALRDQVLAGGAVLGDVARGRDVVGGDGIAEHGQDAHAVEVVDRGGGVHHVVEVRRLLDVGGVGRPTRRCSPVGTGMVLPVVDRHRRRARIRAGTCRRLMAARTVAHFFGWWARCRAGRPACRRDRCRAGRCARSISTVPASA